MIGTSKVLDPLASGGKEQTVLLVKFSSRLVVPIVRKRSVTSRNEPREAGLQQARICEAVSGPIEGLA